MQNRRHVYQACALKGKAIHRETRRKYRTRFHGARIRCRYRRRRINKRAHEEEGIGCSALDASSRGRDVIAIEEGDGAAPGRREYRLAALRRAARAAA